MIVIRLGTQQAPFEPRHLVLVSGLGLLGAITLVLTFAEKPLAGITILAALATLIAAALSGNARLFFLIGLAFVLPLDFSKTFTAYPHFGGEWGVRLEIADPFLLLLSLYWIRESLIGQTGPLRIPGAARWWLALMVEAGVLALFLPYKTLALYELIRMAKAFLLFLLIANTVRRQPLFHWIALALLTCALLQSLYGIAQSFGFSLGLTRLGESRQAVTEAIAGVETSRVDAMLGHPNMFATYLIMVLPLCFTLLFTKLRAGNKMLAFATLVLGSVSLVLTLSRGGWIAFACSLLVIYITSLYSEKLMHRAFWFRVFIAAGILAGSFAAAGKIYQKFTMSSRLSVSSRLDLMHIAQKMIYDKPVLGVGLNSFTVVLPKYDDSGNDWGDMLPPVHNIFLLVWTEQGTVGFVCFLAMIAAVVRTGIRNHQCRDTLLVNINLGALVGFCAVLLQGLVDWTLKGNTATRVFFMLAGLIYAIHFWRIEHEGHVPASNLVSNGGLP